MDTWVGHQVGLELGQVDVEGTIEAERCGDGRHNLANETVKIGVGWTLNVEVAATDVVDCFIVNHEGTIGVLQGGVSGKDGIVRLHHSRRNLRGRVDGKFKFGLLAIVDRQPLHEQRCEARTSATTEAVEDEETLETSTLISLKNKNISISILRTQNSVRDIALSRQKEFYSSCSRLAKQSCANKVVQNEKVSKYLQ